MELVLSSFRLWSVRVARVGRLQNPRSSGTYPPSAAAYGLGDLTRLMFLIFCDDKDTAAAGTTQRRLLLMYAVSAPRCFLQTEH